MREVTVFEQDALSRTRCGKYMITTRLHKLGRAILCYFESSSLSKVVELKPSSIFIINASDPVSISTAVNAIVERESVPQIPVLHPQKTLASLFYLSGPPFPALVALTHHLAANFR